MGETKAYKKYLKKYLKWLTNTKDDEFQKKVLKWLRDNKDNEDMDSEEKKWNLEWYRNLKEDEFRIKYVETWNDYKHWFHSNMTKMTHCDSDFYEKYIIPETEKRNKRWHDKWDRFCLVVTKLEARLKQEGAKKIKDEMREAGELDDNYN